MAISEILGLIGAGGGMVSNILNNQAIHNLNIENMQHEQDMLQRQMTYNETAAENADIRTRALYNDFQSPEAMRKQLQNAGLSVGLMYGQGGAGGSLTSGAQAQAATPQNYGRYTQNPILDAQTANLVANTAKIAAETENIKQDKKKKEAEAANAWKDLDVKTKQMVVMDNQIDQIKQTITESQQRVDNMIEEKINIITKRGDINASINLKKSQEEYNQSLKKLTDIKIEWEPKQQQAQLQNLKALTNQYRAAAKKMMAEAELTEEQKNLLKDQAKDLKKKLTNEILIQEYEKKEVLPAQVKEMNERTYQMINQNYSEEQRRHYYDWVNNNIGQGCGDFLRVVNEDLFPF